MAEGRCLLSWKEEPLLLLPDAVLSTGTEVELGDEAGLDEGDAGVLEDTDPPPHEPSSV